MRTEIVEAAFCVPPHFWSYALFGEHLIETEINDGKLAAVSVHGLDEAAEREIVSAYTKQPEDYDDDHLTFQFHERLSPQQRADLRTNLSYLDNK